MNFKVLPLLLILLTITCLSLRSQGVYNKVTNVQFSNDDYANEMDVSDWTVTCGKINNSPDNIEWMIVKVYKDKFLYAEGFLMLTEYDVDNNIYYYDGNVKEYGVETAASFLTDFNLLAYSGSRFQAGKHMTLNFYKGDDLIKAIYLTF